jgi:hypothetical protein
LRDGKIYPSISNLLAALSASTFKSPANAPIVCNFITTFRPVPGENCNATSVFILVSRMRLKYFLKMWRITAQITIKIKVPIMSHNHFVLISPTSITCMSLI